MQYKNIKQRPFQFLEGTIKRKVEYLNKITEQHFNS